MIYALYGRIAIINADSIILDVHDVFYRIIVSHPELFHLGDQQMIYTRQIVREDDMYLVGFPDNDEREVFNDLISVSGIGPRTAINALRATTPELFYAAIATKDIKYLKKLPGIGPKAASQIILDIKGKLSLNEDADISLNDNVRDALLGLGFKPAEINLALKSVYVPGIDDDELLRRTLKIIRK